METKELEVRRVDLPMELTVDQVVDQVRKIQDVMSKAMKDGEHYGVIPGTKKPTLLKPGAEKLCLLFRFDPQYESTERYDGDHLTVKSKCTLFHITTGIRMGSGEGSCSTKESKYAYRNAALTCPECGKETIIKGKAEFGGGWLCFKKRGGCGEKFPDEHFEGVEVGKVPNENLADQYNTVLKMANKRSLVAAVLNVTAASDIFTQDLEEMPPIVKPTSQPPKQAPVANIKQKLGEAILAFTNNDKTAAAKILEELTGKNTLKDIPDMVANEAMWKFERKYLAVEEEPGTEG